MNPQDYLRQIQEMGDMPNFQEQITKAYDTPVLKPLVNERADLESQYLPSIFEPFTRMGTGAGDMSAAAKLALVGSSLGRLGGRINANNSIQNFYGAQIGDLANRQGQDWQMKNQNLWKLYEAANQRELANRALAAQQVPWDDMANAFGGGQQPTVNSPMAIDKAKNAIIQAALAQLKRIPQVNYMTQDGRPASRAMNPAQSQLVNNLYKQLQVAGYNMNNLVGR